MEEQVVLTQLEMDSIDERLRWLAALEAAGVDNWEGYSYAYAIFIGEETN